MAGQISTSHLDRMGFQVAGLNQVVKGLQQLGLEVDDLKDAFAKIAAEGAKRAADHAPNVTGKLAASIRGNRAKNKAVVLAGRATVKYAGPINYGWPARHIIARGFMQAADEEMRPIALQMLNDDIESKIKEKGLNP